MSDAIKWALLAVGIIVVIGLIVALPISDAIDFNAMTDGITNIVNICGSYLKTARGFLNNLVLGKVGIGILTAVISWLFLRLPLRYGIRLTMKIYHFIFK